MCSFVSVFLQVFSVYICFQGFCFAMFPLKMHPKLGSEVRGDDLVFHSGALRLSVPSTVESLLGLSTAQTGGRIGHLTGYLIA